MRIGRYGEVCVLVVEVDVEVGGGAYDGPVVDVEVVVDDGGGDPPHPANRVIAPIIAAPASSRIPDI
jgi:hypothetical protein